MKTGKVSELFSLPDINLKVVKVVKFRIILRFSGAHSVGFAPIRACSMPMQHKAGRSPFSTFTSLSSPQGYKYHNSQRWPLIRPAIATRPACLSGWPGLPQRLTRPAPAADPARCSHSPAPLVLHGAGPRSGLERHVAPTRRDETACGADETRRATVVGTVAIQLEPTFSWPGRPMSVNLATYSYIYSATSSATKYPFRLKRSS